MLLKNKHIFIVEDNLTNRVVYKMVLTIEGAKISFERWGKEALLQLKQAMPVDLIILDLMLADGISGYDVFCEIRSLPDFRSTPIIAVSAAEPMAAMAKAQSMGFSGYIAKPIDDDLFPMQIAKVISGEQIWSVEGT